MKKIVIAILLVAVIAGIYLFAQKGQKNSSDSRNITSMEDITSEDRTLIAYAIEESSRIMKSGNVGDIRELMINKAGDDQAKIASAKKVSDSSIKSLSSFAATGATITKEMVLQSDKWSFAGDNKVVVKVKTTEHTSSSFDAVYNNGKWY